MHVHQNRHGSAERTRRKKTLLLGTRAISSCLNPVTGSGRTITLVILRDPHKKSREPVYGFSGAGPAAGKANLESSIAIFCWTCST